MSSEAVVYQFPSRREPAAEATHTAVIRAGGRAATARADADLRRADAVARRDRAAAERAEFERRIKIGWSGSS